MESKIIYPAVSSRAAMDRRTFCGAALTLGVLHPAILATPLNLSSLSGESKAPALKQPDISRWIVDSTISRCPQANQFGGWTYFRALFLLGQYMVYKRTKDPAYLAYLRAWVDSHVSEAGVIDQPISGLDYMQPGNLLVLLFQETNEPRYRIAAQTIRNRYVTYPRTADGGFWHSSTEEYKKHELWLDGTYMSLPFLMRYGNAFGGGRAACDEAAKQLLIDYKHNRSTSCGLLYHAYDELGRAPWAEPVTHHSSVFWCRSIGWYCMALVDSLDVLPVDHPERKALLSIVQGLAMSLARYQDAASGLWFQVVDQSRLPGNWLETSSSSMFVYFLSVAAKRGYIASKYRDVAAHGYRGVLGQITSGTDGLANIHNICEGTDVGDAAYYLARPRSSNDPHGLGAFLLMNEEWNSSTASMSSLT